MQDRIEGETMEIDDSATTHEQRVEDYARRTAKAAETIQSGLMLLLALAILAGVIGLAFALRG